MGLIQNLVKKIGENKKEYKDKLRQAEMDMKVQKKLEERQKSSNERELEDYIEKQRQSKIKAELDKIHKKQNEEAWRPKNMILNQKTTILKEDRPILMEKNIFMDNRTRIPFIGGRNRR